MKFDLTNLADFPAHIVAAHSWRNKQYGIPFIGNPIVPWFNASLYANYGVTSPVDHVKANRWTLTQWLDSARATTRGRSTPQLCCLRFSPERCRTFGRRLQL